MIKILILSAGLALSLTGAAFAQSQNKVEIVTAAAERWLSIIDNEGYAAAWEETSHYLKTILPKSDWLKAVTAARKPLGKKLNRKPLAVQYTRELPGAPDGEYVVMQFDTSFESKRKSVETLTLKLDLDGKWRVSGYYIR